jgi:hypothetical protein
MPRGVDYRIPLAAVRQAAADHEAGWSLRALARMRYRDWGYASPGSALEGLRHAMRSLDLPIRDRVAATIDAHTVHGNATRAAHEPGHPDHQRFLDHRNALRRAARARSRAAA